MLYGSFKSFSVYITISLFEQFFFLLFFLSFYSFLNNIPSSRAILFTEHSFLSGVFGNEACL